jgi:hypothetical protein
MNIRMKSVMGLPASAAAAAAPGDATFALTGEVDLAGEADSAAAVGVAAEGVPSPAGVDSELPADGFVAAPWRGALRAPLAFPADESSPFGVFGEELPCELSCDDERPEDAPVEFPEPPESAVATGMDATEAPTPSATASTPTRPTQRA